MSNNDTRRWNYPATKTVDVTEDYFGQKVSDPYRWLENLQDEEVKTWFKQQAGYTESILNNIPGKNQLLQEYLEYDKVVTTKYNIIVKRGERYFFEKRLAGEDLFKVYYRDGESGADVLLFDPLNYEPGKAMDCHWSVNHSGTMLLLSLAEKGKEIGFMRLMQVADKSYLPETIPFSAGMFVAGSDTQVIYIKRKNDDVHDMDNALDMQLKLHLCGKAESDDMVVFSREKYPAVGLLPEQIPYVITFEKGDYMLGVKAGVELNQELFYAPLNTLADAHINWVPFCVYADEVRNTHIRGASIYYVTVKGNNNGTLMKLTLPANLSSSAEIFRGGEWKIEEIEATKDYLLILLSKNGVEYILKKLEFSTGIISDVSLPLTGTLIVKPFGVDTNLCTILNSSWAVPGNNYEVDAHSGAFRKGPFNMKFQNDDLQYLVSEEVEVASHDGEMVPLSIVYDKRLLKRDGTNIVWMNGYGAYGMNAFTPAFQFNYLVPLKRGVVMAYAHVRGGGEKGDRWHLAGRKETKPNTWKDLIACAEYLIANKYASAQTMGISGGSAGGVMVGRAVTERPDLFRVAVPRVGSMNTLRAENSPNGPVNVPEFGTVNIESECKALIEMDSYLHVEKGTAYPAQLIGTGFNDPRVISWEPAKYAAAMQAANTSSSPQLLEVNYKGGHFGGTTITELYEEKAKMYAFLLWQCGYPGFQPA